MQDRNETRFAGIQLDDERVSWKVPTLFDNDWTALTLAHELAPVLAKPLFSTAYGSPACAWAGGRICRVTESPSEESLRQHFEAYLKVGARCALTFSRPDAGQFLDDPYCNMVLDLLDEYGGQTIVVDDTLARHIRTTHPGIKLVASNNRVVLDRWKGFEGKDEADYYRDLLDFYDEVVVRVEAAHYDSLTQQVAEFADRVELIVNQLCAKECAYAPEHIANIARKMKGEERPEDTGVSCIHYLRHGGRDLRDTIYVPRDKRRELVDMGYRTFKISGRHTSPMALATTLIYEILQPEDDTTMRPHDSQLLSDAEYKDKSVGLLDRDDIRELLHPVTVMEAFKAGPELLTSIPEALQ